MIGKGSGSFFSLPIFFLDKPLVTYDNKISFTINEEDKENL